MANVSDPRLKEAYEQVRSDRDPTSWALAGYENNNTIVLKGTGTGGWEEFVANFPQGDCAFGYFRFTTGDDESKRAKFVLLAWTPDDASVMRKARMSVHRASVKEVWREFSYELCASDAAEVEEEKVRDAVIKAGGANYMGQNFSK